MEKKVLEKKAIEGRIKLSKSVLPFCKKGKLLDIGCGFGHVSNFFHKKGFIVEGFDINKKKILKCKEKYKGIDFYVKDVSQKIEGKYDVILLIGVLEEISLPPKEVLKKLKKNLKKEGRIIIAVRNTNALRRRIKG
ncbi:unnamed protein product, partial [marine sediment metagenome]